MKRLLFLLMAAVALPLMATPIDDLLERIDKGASRKFKI